MNTHRGRLLLLIVLLLLPASLAQGQSYTTAPTPFQTAFDNNGLIVNGGCIWTYAAGTTTPITTYADTIGTTNTDPIIADSAGRFTVYLISGTAYKFVYENVPCSSILHGSVLRTQDQIAETLALSSGGVIGPGTINTLPVLATTNTLGNSLVSQNGTQLIVAGTLASNVFGTSTFVAGGTGGEVVGIQNVTAGTGNYGQVYSALWSLR